MAVILDKMVNADVIVMATPVYFYSMDGQMKTFIDRTVPRYTMETFRGFTEDCLEGAKEAGIIYGTGAWQVGKIKSTGAYEEAYEMGRNI